jgi:hypothetical protein
MYEINVKIDKNKLFSVLKYTYNPYNELKRVHKDNPDRLYEAICHFAIFPLYIGEYGEIEKKIRNIFGSRNDDRLIAIVEKEKENIEILSAPMIENSMNAIKLGAGAYTSGGLNEHLTTKEKLLSVLGWYVNNVLKPDEDDKKKAVEYYYGELGYITEEVLALCMRNLNDTRIYWWAYACQLTGYNPGVFASAADTITTRADGTPYGPM